jgi:2-polyprenyl-6-methoxyphenol hydroxylase-like FAD-dependent oxidoreductase
MNQLTVNPSAYDVVFVGGGPVGLWTALQTKLRNPKLNVVVLEKYTEYQRLHNLFLESQSMSTDCKSPEMGALLAKLKAKPLLSTHLLESELVKAAQNAGVIIHKNISIQNPEKDLACFTNARVIVGADGAHSIMRSAVVLEKPDNCLTKQEDIHYICDLSYIEQNEPVGTLRKVAMNSAVGNIMYEIHGKRSQKTTLRTFISKEVFERMKEAKRKAPMPLDDPRVDPKVRQEFLSFISMKYGKEQSAHIDLSQATITTTSLGTYVSKKFVRKDGSKHWCLVGDAAFGVPYFRSLNNGFLSGTLLSKTIAAHYEVPAQQVNSKSFSMFQPLTFDDYENATRKLAHQQVWKANAKAHAINAGIRVVRSTHSITAQS